MKNKGFLLILNALLLLASLASADVENPKLFSITQNDHKELVVELGDFATYYGLTNPIYQVAVILNEQKILVKDISGSAKTLRIPIEHSGMYEFYMYQPGKKMFWRQNVYAVRQQDISITDAEAARLAEIYSPVVSYSNDETYYPTSLEYIFNMVDKDEELDNESFILKGLEPPREIQKSVTNLIFSDKMSLSLSFKDLQAVLPYMGTSDAVLKSGLRDFSLSRMRARTGAKRPQIYYSVTESPEKNQVALTYHFFYSFDSKAGDTKKDSWGDHIFDRESMSVILDRSTQAPLYVIYNAHMTNQEVAFVNRKDDVVQTWKQGRVFVDWSEVPKNGGHPQAYAALGSHALYPVQGTYALLRFGHLKYLKEFAGGERYLVPSTLSKTVHMFLPDAGTRTAYKLTPLSLSDLTSTASDISRVLTFSGSLVDVLGGRNAAFPPFVAGKGNFRTYLDVQEAFHFDMKKAYEVGY